VTEQARRPRRRWKYLLIAAGSLIVLLLAALWYTTTDSFQAYVRHRMISELERLTGGRAEIGSFHVVPFHMQVEVRDITVHGSEAANDVPLAHADHLFAEVKVVSFLRTEFGFHSLTLDHPVIHIAVDAAGKTNVPAAVLPAQNSAKTAVEQLFALSIDHLSMHNGELIWGDRKIPLDFTVQEAAAQMDYSFLRGRYESRLSLGKVDIALENFRPFSWMASVELSLGATFADVKSLQWTSGRSHVEASGRVSDFRNPHLDGSYDAHVDLQEAGSIARQKELREGIAEFKGSGHWSFDDFNASGNLALRDLVWQDDQIAVKKASATTDYSLTDQQIKLSKMQGRAFGGSFTGDLQVANWLHSTPLTAAAKAKPGREDMPVIRQDMPSISAARPPAKKGEKIKPPGVQAGAIHLRIRDVSAAEIAASLDLPAHPLNHFHPAGLATGTVEATWKGSPVDADISFALETNPPAHLATDELPITAHIQGTYRASISTLELLRFDVTTPASRVQAAGTTGAGSAMHLSVATSNLDEWRPLVRAFGGPNNLPFQINGQATFNGSVTGSLSSPTLAGNLVAQDFDFTVPETSRTPQQQVHWDALSSNVQLSSREIALHGGTLKRGETNADFDVTAFLQDGLLTENSPINARVNLHKVDVASTAAVAGFDYPISGNADISVQMNGTRANPQVQGHIHAVDAAAYGESIEKFDADLHMAGDETGLSNILLAHQDAVVTGSAAYRFNSHSFQLDLQGQNFDLARVRQIHDPNLLPEGRADFTLKASGTRDAPDITASIHARDLTLAHELSGGVYLDAVTTNRDLHLTGHSELVKGIFTLDGTIGLHGDYPVNVTAHTDHMDLDFFWHAYLGEQLTAHSVASGVVTLQGPLRYPAKLILTGDGTDVAIELEHDKLHNQGPLHFKYYDGVAHIDPVHMIGDGSDGTGHGTIGFTGKRELDLTADGQVDLKLLSAFNPDVTASGAAIGHATVTGDLDHPIYLGRIQLQNGTINYAGLPSGLSEMAGVLVFTGDSIHIEQLTARAGGGTVDFNGDITNYNQQFNFNLSATGKDVRLRYPPGVSSTATADLHWTGNRSASTVSGDVMVNKLAVTPGFDFSSYLEKTRQSAGIAPATSPLYNVKLDVAVRTAPELQMKTAVARLSGDADLRVRGSAARPSILGRADILEGDATFNGIKFRLERGDITFANPVAIEPQVNLQATTHVRNYDLDITVTGTTDRLNVNYRSEPPLPKSDIIALLALGRTQQESEQLQQQSGQTMFSDVASNLIINQAINQTVSSRMQKLFGVSRIKIDPQGLTTETNPTARGPQVTIEQQFANNISLTYSTNVSQTAEQIIQGEYYFTRSISVIATRDQNGVVSLDVRIRRFRK
jgi:translocation and assembly module TamB